MPTIFKPNGYNKEVIYEKINKRLPQILLPTNKIKMFADWWNSDIRFESTVPHSFEEGYFTVNSLPSISMEKFKPYIKDLARDHHTTYRDIENQLTEHLDEMQELSLHFLFTTETNIKCVLFSKKTNRIICVLNCTIGIDNGMRDKKLLFDEDVFASIKEDMKIEPDCMGPRNGV